MGLDGQHFGQHPKERIMSHDTATTSALPEIDLDEIGLLIVRANSTLELAFLVAEERSAAEMPIIEGIGAAQGWLKAALDRLP